MTEFAIQMTPAFNNAAHTERSTGVESKECAEIASAASSVQHQGRDWKSTFIKAALITGVAIAAISTVALIFAAFLPSILASIPFVAAVTSVLKLPGAFDPSSGTCPYQTHAPREQDITPSLEIFIVKSTT